MGGNFYVYRLFIGGARDENGREEFGLGNMDFKPDRGSWTNPFVHDRLSHLVARDTVTLARVYR